MATLTESVVKALRELADRVEKRGLRSANFNTQLELIEIPSEGWKEYRPGPACLITLMLDWANIEPADTEAGEVSDWEQRMGKLG